jgi:hypothetical protein
MRTTLTTSIQFGGPDGRTVINDDIASHVIPANTLPDSQRGNHHIQVRTSGFARYQQHEGVATPGNATTSVQLLQDDGLVKVGGYEVKPEVAERLKGAAPQLFISDDAKAIEAAKESDNAKDDEALREELNRHADVTLEGYHQHVVGEVSPQSLISLMVHAQRGEAPPTSLLSNIARDMGETVGDALTKINAVNEGVLRQFTNLATAMGLNPDKAADWLRDHRKDTSMAAMQAHYLRRSVMSWKPLLEDYRSATGDGVKH